MEIDQLSALRAQGVFRAKLDLLEEQLQNGHECPYLLTQKAMLIQLQGGESSLEDAEQCLLRAHEINPNNLETLVELAHFYDAVIPNPEQAKHYATLFRDAVTGSLESLREILE